MQELIELIENGETELYLIENHKQIWLEREKEQIIDAYTEGYTNWDSEMTSEEYYNQTYNHLHIVTDDKVGLSNPDETTNNKLTINQNK